LSRHSRHRSQYFIIGRLAIGWPLVNVGYAAVIAGHWLLPGGQLAGLTLHEYVADIAYVIVNNIG